MSKKMDEYETLFNEEILKFRRFVAGLAEDIYSGPGAEVYTPDAKRLALYLEKKFQMIDSFLNNRSKGRIPPDAEYIDPRGAAENDADLAARAATRMVARERAKDSTGAVNVLAESRILDNLERVMQDLSVDEIMHRDNIRKKSGTVAEQVIRGLRKPSDKNKQQR